MEVFVAEHAEASATTLRGLEGAEPQGAMSGNRKLLNCFFLGLLLLGPGWIAVAALRVLAGYPACLAES
jgi:hypothetical protein